MATTYKQDMPPTGGYKPLQWERIKLRTIFTPGRTLALYTVVTLGGFVLYYKGYKEVKRDEIEMRSARFAILPVLIAERDRAFLKQIRKNRDEEREVMKNVPEWEVGTYFREPVYIKHQDKLLEPTYFEFMAHADFWDANLRVFRRSFT